MFIEIDKLSHMPLYLNKMVTAVIVATKLNLGFKIEISHNTLSR